MEIPQELSPCVKKALSRLSRGDMTCGEMLSYLTDPKRPYTAFSQQAAERTVALLQAEGFLDDKRYLRLAVQRLDAKLLGPRRIREELTRHLFPPSYVAAACERKVDYARRGEKLLGKKAGAKALAETPEGRNKLVAALVRQGYDFATARSAVRAFSREEDDFSEESE